MVRMGLSGGVTESRLPRGLWEIEVKFVREEVKDEALQIEILYCVERLKL